ncbi:MAG TPA: adenylate/guanylate cyclase domain-containing protein [Actinomycetota bacterium]|nr:adenylate/guanylate cyclase domain-containing protein [Actinomycetota bacterium]
MRLDPDSLPSLLEASGVAAEEIHRAVADGPAAVVSLAIERLVIPGSQRLTRSEVAERAGTDLEEAMQFWRAMGFSDVSDDEPAFTEVDVEMLSRARRLIEEGFADAEMALQMTRVMAHAVSRIAASQVEVVRERGRETQAEDEDAAYGFAMALTAAGVQGLLGDLEDFLVYLWRRHLGAVADRAVHQVVTGEQAAVVVGFADLVGFTAISQQLAERELAAVVGRFEDAAAAQVAAHRGRIIKMIGDEVMFTAPDPREGAEIALALVETFAADDQIPDVRVGLAAGTAVAHRGDLYGPAPNLASRLVDSAYPASVLVDGTVAAELEGADAFHLKPVRPQRLQGFGRTRMWVLRRSRA